MEYTVIIPSHRKELQDEAFIHLKSIGINPLLKNGTGYDSFSKLINHCILECPTEIVIICNDKSRPTKKFIDKTLSLLDSGYGFVGLYCFGFFGFSKELIRRVGFFDERFVGGGYEDCDYIRRMNESDIAGYFTYEIDYLEHIPSSRSGNNSEIHFVNKWDDATPETLVCKRKLQEEKYNYELGESTGKIFLPWNHTYIPDSAWFKEAIII